MELIRADMPARVARAIAAMRQLESEGVHFAPIRHHSPACARAVADLIDHVGPSTVLIEGPEEYTSLVPELARAETKPPVAILSTAGGSATANGFFPIADYSPEWVALRAGVARGSEVAFIDTSWSTRAPAEPIDANERLLTESIQAERYLTHSRTLADLARRLHCRDHDELWDHLFELRVWRNTSDSRLLLDDVFVWSALARTEYEPDVLLADRSIEREALMAARIAEHRSRGSGPIVVVTGAFHTLSLVEALAGAEEGDAVRNLIPRDGFPAPSSGAGTAWLIRFDYARLDALSGYGAGMPSPGYYGRMWAAPAGTDPSLEMLLDVAHRVSDAHTSELVGIADVSSAMLTAERLADLRGRERIGRTDLLDAILSSFTKGEDDGSPALRAAMRSVFVGNELGEVPAGTAAPPVVAEARSRALAAKLLVADSAVHAVSLDLRRKPAHRERSRFLNLMEFIGTGFASRSAGPDFVSGRGLGRLLEGWNYAWTPLVEARLIDLSARGATLDEIALARLDEIESSLADSPDARSASAAVDLLAQAATVGLTDHLPRLVDLAADRLAADASIGSVLAASLRLFALWSGRAELDLGDAIPVLALLERAVAALAFRVPTLSATAAEEDDTVVGTLVELRGLVSRVVEQTQIDPEPITRETDRLRQNSDTSPAVRGALVGLAAVDGRLDDEELASMVLSQLGVGAEIPSAVRFLAGFMRAAPDLILRDPVLLQTVETGILALSADSFLAYLPDLRRAFSWLKPTETAALAERIADGSGLQLTVVRTDLTAEDLRAGIELQRMLADSLAADGLADWAGEGS